MSQFEPARDYVKKLFRNYREIRVRVLGWLRESSAKRAELANRFRRSKSIKRGDEVVVRDPRQREAGGRRAGTACEEEHSHCKIPYVPDYGK